MGLFRLLLSIAEWAQARNRKEMAGTVASPMGHVPVLLVGDELAPSEIAIPPKPPALKPGAEKPAPATLADLWHGDVPYAAISLSEAFEGRKLSPYKDSNGTWTIGVGSTTDMKGNRVTASTPPITDAMADVMAMRDLEKAAGLVRKACPGPLTNRQAAVLILMANNLGDLRVAGPTLVRLVNSQKWREAADFMAKFSNERINGVLTPSKGLRRRRWAEAAFFLGMDPAKAKARAWAEINDTVTWPPLG
ncbi:lysozyme [Muricoccus aerilatus]|uniref:lysozyme n=1 Tax=Muricoccus aerilatus TaxID=452982 RepID=UPI000694A743|nr:lysozyme [Roseomonas aerilata]